MKMMNGDKIIDPRTRIPWPIAPRAELPERQRGKAANVDRLADDHHPAEGREALVRGSVSDRALRYARCQWTLYRDHHDGFHKNGLSSMLPDSNYDRFRYITFAAAGFLPDKSIGFHETKHDLRASVEPLTARDRQLMWERGDVRVDRPLSVNRFLAWQAISSGVSALHSSFDFRLRDSFRADPEPNTLPFTARLVELAVSSHNLGEDYRAARAEGLLPSTAPPTAKELLVGRVYEYSQTYGQSPIAEQESVPMMISRALCSQTATLALAQAS